MYHTEKSKKKSVKVIERDCTEFIELFIDELRQIATTQTVIGANQ